MVFSDARVHIPLLTIQARPIPIIDNKVFSHNIVDIIGTNAGTATGIAKSVRTCLGSF
ncbi:hypothetical protein [Spiroplasma endosymbiont of Melieria omissa]|uniref:hypothetical protein n=1 Tax=Spiroplasma endosymbiont of Melieria omissa TaxID=3139324 RepID=UPI003CCA8151